MKWYGGVPIITEVQEPVAGAITPRSTTKACVDFICEDLERSAQLLAPFTEMEDGLQVILDVLLPVQHWH